MDSNNYIVKKARKSYEFIKELFRLNGNFFMPASLTFYFIISFIPLVSIVFMILSFYSNNSTDAVISLLNSLHIFPENMVKEFVSYIKTINMTDYITLIISIVASIYVASRGVECFSRFSNTFYGIDDKKVNFIRRKARSILITFLLIIMISVCIIIYALFSALFENYINYGLSIFIKYLSLAVLLFLIVLFIFKEAPNKKQKTLDMLPGAVICVISLIICLFVYAIYLKYSFTRMTSVYGPLTSVIILLLVVFVIAYIVFISFYFNILLKEKRTKKITTKSVYDLKHEKVVFIDNKTIKVNSINNQINDTKIQPEK